MTDLNTLNISSWEKETLQDLIEEEYPNLLDLSSEELTKLSQKLYWEAESMYNRVCLLESQSDAIALLAKIKKEQNL